MKRLVLFFILIIFFSLNFTAEADPVYSPGSHKIKVSLLLKGQQPMGDFQSVVVPLKRAGRLFLIEAKIDGQDGNLVFDTGANGLVLNRTYFRNYTGSTRAASGGVSGSAGNIINTVVERVDITGLYYEDVEADLANLGHIEDRRGFKILGLFGLNLINDLEVVFDAEKSELRLNRIDKDGNRLSTDTPAEKFDYTQELKTGNNVLIIRAKISDKELNFCLDTGAEINVIHYALPKKVLGTVEIKRRSDLGGSGSGTVKALYGIMNDLQFGTQQFGRMDVAIINLSSMSEAYGVTIDGMLGYDFWQKGVFCMNFRKRIISFNIAKGGEK